MHYFGMKEMSAKLFCFSCHYGCNLLAIRIAYPRSRAVPKPELLAQNNNHSHIYIHGCVLYILQTRSHNTNTILYCQSAINLIIIVSIGYSLLAIKNILKTCTVFIVVNHFGKKIKINQ